MKIFHGQLVLQRRDLNPGDVFFYLENQENVTCHVGRIRYVQTADGAAPPWVLTLRKDHVPEASPNPNYKGLAEGFLSKETLNAAVHVIEKGDFK